MSCLVVAFHDISCQVSQRVVLAFLFVAWHGVGNINVKKWRARAEELGEDPAGDRS